MRRSRRRDRRLGVFGMEVPDRTLAPGGSASRFGHVPSEKPPRPTQTGPPASTGGPRPAWPGVAQGRERVFLSAALEGRRHPIPDPIRGRVPPQRGRPHRPFPCGGRLRRSRWPGRTCRSRGHPCPTTRRGASARIEAAARAPGASDGDGSAAWPSSARSDGTSSAGAVGAATEPTTRAQGRSGDCFRLPARWSPTRSSRSRGGRPRRPGSRVRPRCDPPAALVAGGGDPRRGPAGPGDSGRPRARGAWVRGRRPHRGRLRALACLRPDPR